MFAGLEEENDEDIEIEKAMEMYRKKGGVIIGRCLLFAVTLGASHCQPLNSSLFFARPW